MSLPLSIARHLPRELVPEASWSAIRRVADDLPDVASTFYLERPLGAAAAERVDFLACVAAEGGAPERLGAWFRRRGWARLRAFAEEWARPGTLLHRQVPFVWLELDAPYEEPNLLACTDPTPLESFRGGNAEWDGRPEVHQEVIERAAELLLGAPVPREARDVMRRCHQYGRILHLSVMSARSPAALKLNVSLPRRHLRDLGWPGLERFAPDSDLVRLDVTPGSSRLGLEFFDARDRRSRDALLDTCLAAGVCTPHQRAALRRWPGSERSPRPGGAWPARVSRWTDAKLVFEGDQLVAAKAYLGVSSHFSLC
jgi:hypothetical protein